MLRALAGVHEDEAPSRESIEQQVRQEVVGRITAGLMELAGAPGEAIELLAGGEAAPGTAAEPAPAPAGAGDGMAPWIDTDECTACDECVDLNPEIFAYNDNHKAVIKDPAGGPYRDLVKAAERCTAQVIHPGLPRDRSEKDAEKWIKRAEKYN
jgi:pyruvate-ferredoxin/flavodoxin oxidoreductase